MYKVIQIKPFWSSAIIGFYESKLFFLTGALDCIKNIKSMKVLSCSLFCGVSMVQLKWCLYNVNKPFYINR